MPRKRTVLTDEQFFASLNDRDDLTAVIHGHAELARLLDEGVARLLADHGMKSEQVLRLGVVGKVDVLTLADRLDPETRDLFEHLTRVRNRFAHDFGKVVSAAEGRAAWDRLPQPAKDRAPASLTRTSPPGRIVRWCIVVLRARIQNRSIYLQKGDIPYS